MYNEAEEFLEESTIILAKLRDYRGATKEIRYKGVLLPLAASLNFHFIFDYQFSPLTLHLVLFSFSCTFGRMSL